MNISITIPDNIEATLRRKAAEHGEDLSDYLVRMVVEDADDKLPTPPSNETTEAFILRLHEMVQRHGVRSGHVDDSRESIYAGCGE